MAGRNGGGTGSGQHGAPDGSMAADAPSVNAPGPVGQPRSTDGPALRVLTLNAHQGLGGGRRRALLDGIRQALPAIGADLVFLQEVGGDDTGSTPAQYELLADRIWPRHAYGRNAVAPGGHHGNALLSKHPLGDWRNIELPAAGAEPRGLLHCQVRVPDAPLLHAFCVHLGLRESQRRLQLEVLLAALREAVPAGAPVVVAGDFNDWRVLAHRRLLGAGLREVHAAAYGAPARSFPARWPLLRLDRIYVRHMRHAPLPIAWRPWRHLSDHLPLAATLRLPAAPRG